MTVVLDTTILIDHLCELGAARAALSETLRSDERVCASVLSKTEIIAGERAGEETAIQPLFRQLEWVDVDNAIAIRAGELARQFMHTHRDIEVVDYVIAATAQLLGAELWTRNRKHFPMFPELPEPYR